MRSAALVGDGLLRSGGEVLDCGVRIDTLLGGELLAVGCLGVDLGNYNRGLVDVICGERLPDGLEGLAVCDLVSLRPYWTSSSINTYGRTMVQ